MTRRGWAAALVVCLLASLLAVLAAGPAPARSKPPSITRVGPAQGPVAGETKVTITGRHLGATKRVTFGGVKGTRLKVRSDRKLTVVAPPHAAGRVAVQVRGADGRSRTSAGARFTYLTASGAGATPPPDQPPPPPAGLVGTAAPAPAGAALDPRLQIHDLVCPGVGACLAVGSYVRSNGQTRPLVESFSGGAWTASGLPAPPGGADHPASLSAVSCGGVDSCVALGAYVRAPGGPRHFVATWDGAAWELELLPLPRDVAGNNVFAYEDLACGSPTSCVAAGAYLATGDRMRPLVATATAGTWALADVPLPSGATQAELYDAVCAAHQACTVTGSWTAGAAGQRPLALALAGTAWAAADLPLPADARTDPASGIVATLDCPTPTACTAVGHYTDSVDLPRGFVSHAGPGGWETVRLSEPASAPGATTSLGQVSCWAPRQCTAIGGYTPVGEQRVRPLVALVDGGAVSTVTVPRPSGSHAALAELDCAAVARCVAGGFTEEAEDRNTSLVAQLAGADVVTRRVSLPAGGFGGALTQVAGDSPTTVVAVGHFYLGAGAGVLLVSGVPR